MVVRIVGTGEEVATGQIPFTPRAKKVLELALREALSLGHNYIGTEHILLGLIREDEGVAARILLDLDAEPEKIRNEVMRTLSGPTRRGQTGGPESKKNPKMLDQFGRNLTKLAEEGKLDPCIGRATEIERVMQILSRRTKNNPVLIGEPGVGKTAVVEGFAQRIASNEVPELLNVSAAVRIENVRPEDSLNNSNHGNHGGYSHVDDQEPAQIVFRAHDRIAYEHQRDVVEVQLHPQ